MKCGKRNRRFERVLCLLLALLLPSGLLPAASAKAADEDTLSIGTVQELLDFSKSCSLDTWSQGKTVVLTADLSLEGVDFSPSRPSAGFLTETDIPSGGSPFRTETTRAGCLGFCRRAGKFEISMPQARCRPRGMPIPWAALWESVTGKS